MLPQIYFAKHTDILLRIQPLMYNTDDNGLYVSDKTESEVNDTRNILLANGFIELNQTQFNLDDEQLITYLDNL